MTDSAFDPNVFLHAQVNEVNEKRPPLPAGSYTAVIGEVKPNSGTYEKGDRVGQPWLQMLVPLIVQVPQEVQDKMGMKLEKGTMTLTDRPFIDLLPNGKGIDNSVGKNRAQKMYREAVDLNKAGDSFAWAMLTGKAVKVQVEHEMYQGSPVERVGMVLRLS